MTELLKSQLLTMEQRFADWASTRGVVMLRISLGLIFLWFGALKFCPGLCDVEVLAAKTMQLLTFGLLPAKICLRLLAVAECAIGAGLIAGRWMRLVTICLVLHLAGTFLPMLLFPAETWKHFPFAPTLVGQYIVKNLVLIAAGVVVGASAFSHRRRLQVVSIQSRRTVHPQVRKQFLGGV